MDLKQDAADSLLALEKMKVDDTVHEFPSFGGDWRIPLKPRDEGIPEEFSLDVWRGKIELTKTRLQNRVRQTIILARLDLSGPPHRNPDGEEVPGTHLHVYREGYGDKWAFPVSHEIFTNPVDPWQTLLDFMVYCNITETPNINRGLFS